MRISLLLCLFLTVTVSVLANQSDPFNQNGSDTPKEIKTDMVEPNRYRGLAARIVKAAHNGTNIASGLMSIGVASYALLVKQYGLFAYVASDLLLTVPAVLVDPEKNPVDSNIVGSALVIRSLWNGLILYFSSNIINITPTEKLYFSIQLASGLSGFAYHFFFGKKKQN